MRSAGAGRTAAASSTEELVVRLCGSAEAAAAVLGARRTGGSTAPPCSEHLVRLCRKSQEREGSCAHQSNIEAHWLDWAKSQKANPPKPTAAQSISGDEATENDSQKYGEGVRRLEVLMGLPGTVVDVFLKSCWISTNTSTNTSGGTSWNSKKDP